MESATQTILSVILAVLASSGFWAFITHRKETRGARAKMLMGLAHDRIMFLGTLYVDRGCITADEYENLNNYLYEPYVALGGNGSAERLMSLVKKLPPPPHKQSDETEASSND